MGLIVCVSGWLFACVVGGVCECPFVCELVRVVLCVCFCPSPGVHLHARLFPGVVALLVCVYVNLCVQLCVCVCVCVCLVVRVRLCV